jgi:serine/threonine protein kinase
MARLYDDTIGLPKLPWEKIKRFNLDELDITATLGEGTYGETKLGTIKSTGEEIILKFFKDYDRVLNDDITHELIFLTYLNQFPDTKTVKLYGYILDDSKPFDLKFGLVLEKLEKTLGGFTKRKKDDDTAFRGRLTPKEYKLLFYKMLKGLANIHGLGIVHNDIKLENIMISRTDIRYIDFGLSKYLGITPLKPNVENYITTEVFMAPDKKDTKSEKYIDGNRHSYGSDVYSLGVTFLDMLYRNYWVYRWTPDDILCLDQEDLSVSGDSCKDFIIDRLKIDIIKGDSLPMIDGSNGFDLIHKMINPDAKKRISAKEALLHPYFSDILALETTETLERILALGGARLEFLERDLYMGISQEIYDNKNFEIGYINEIFENTKNDVINVSGIKLTGKHLMSIDYILYIIKGEYFSKTYSLIALLSTINYIRRLDFSSPPYFSTVEITMFFSFFDSAFNYVHYVEDRLLRSFNGRKAIEYKEYIPKLLENYSTDFITIPNQIDYVILKLQYEFKDPRILPFLEELKDYLIMYCIFLCFTPANMNKTNWELISVLTTHIISYLVDIPVTDLLARPIIEGLILGDYLETIKSIHTEILMILIVLEKQYKFKPDTVENLYEIQNKLFSIIANKSKPTPVLPPSTTIEPPKP